MPYVEVSLLKLYFVLKGELDYLGRPIVSRLA